MCIVFFPLCVYIYICMLSLGKIAKNLKIDEHDVHEKMMLLPVVSCLKKGPSIEISTQVLLTFFQVLMEELNTAFQKCKT